MKRFLVAIVAAAGLVAIAPSAGAASTWTDIPTAIEPKMTTSCSQYLDPPACQVGAYRLDMSWGLGDPIDEGKTASMYRKVGKKWVRVPIGSGSANTPLSGVGTHSVIYPQADKFVPGTYMLVFTEDSRAQWKCSVYWREVCRWVGAYSFSTAYRFQWSGTALYGAQLNFSFKG